MAGDASWTLQRAILTALEGDADIRSLLGADGRVIPPAGDPDDDSVAAVRYGNSIARSWHSATFDGQEHDILLHLVCPPQGPDIRALAAAVAACLHDADLPLAGHALVELQFMSSETRHEDPGAVARCRMYFKALTVSD